MSGFQFLRGRRLAVLLFIITEGVPAQTPAASVRLTPQLIPSGPMRRHSAQLSVTVDTNKALTDVKLTVVAPNGFSVAHVASGAAESFAQTVTISMGALNASSIATVAVRGDPTKLNGLSTGFK